MLEDIKLHGKDAMPSAVATLQMLYGVPEGKAINTPKNPPIRTGDGLAVVGAVVDGAATDQSTTALLLSQDPCLSITEAADLVGAKFFDEHDAVREGVIGTKTYVAEFPGLYVTLNGTDPKRQCISSMWFHRHPERTQ